MYTCIRQSPHAQSLDGLGKKFWQKGAFKTIARVAGGVVGFYIGGPAGAAIGAGLVKTGEKGTKKAFTAKQIGKGIKEGVKVGAVTYAATKIVPSLMSKGGIFKSGLKYGSMAKSALSGGGGKAGMYDPQQAGEAGAGPSMFTTAIDMAGQVLPFAGTFMAGDQSEGPQSLGPATGQPARQVPVTQQSGGLSSQQWLVPLAIGGGLLAIFMLKNDG